MRQRPSPLPRNRRLTVARARQSVRSGHCRARALRRGRRRRQRRRRAHRPGRRARHGASLWRLRHLPALPHRLDADVRRRQHRLWQDRPWRACAVHESTVLYTGAAAGRIVVRRRRGDLLRHRHRLSGAAADQSRRRRHHRHCRPGPGGPFGDAVRRGDGRARHRARRQRRAACARQGIRRRRPDRSGQQ